MPSSGVADASLQVSVPYLRSEYGKEYDFDAPVKLLDSMMHAMADQPNQQVVVLGQVRLADHPPSDPPFALPWPLQVTFPTCTASMAGM